MEDQPSFRRGGLDEPVANWHLERKQEYFYRAAKVVAGGRDVHPDLHRSSTSCTPDGQSDLSFVSEIDPQALMHDEF